MEALRKTDKIRRAVFYEPPLPMSGGIGDQSADSVCGAVATGDNERAMLTFFRDYVRMPEPVIDAMRRDPSWPERVALAPSTCREADAVFHYRFDPARFSKVSVQTLFLLGELSPEPMKVSVRAAANAFPGGRIQVIPGQSHGAMSAAPELLAGMVQRFLET
jgi:pimeloyl-ACP methyl ester carboxylesterase